MKKKLNIVELMKERKYLMTKIEIHLENSIIFCSFSVIRRYIKIRIDMLIDIDGNSVPLSNRYCDRLARIFINGNATYERRCRIISERTNGENRDGNEMNERRG